MPKKFKIIFTFSGVLALALLAVISALNITETEIDALAVLLFFLRGGFLFALLFGALSCYIAYRFFHTK